MRLYTDMYYYWVSSFLRGLWHEDIFVLGQLCAEVTT